jgi:Ca2+-binding RTX toxin-like protein
MYGTAGSDTIRGLEGDDYLMPKEGNDFIYAGAGNDTIASSAGDDRIDGGDDTDVAFIGYFENYDLRWDPVLQQYTLTDLVGDGGTDILVNVEYLDSYGVRAPVASEAAARFQVGTEGADMLRGSSFADSLQGMGGDDSLYGSGGADTLEGGAGRDVLDGGSGSDVFVFGAGAFDGVDTVYGFAQAQDRISLDHTVFTGLEAGALARGAFETVAGSAATGGDARILFDTNTATLSSDADGSGALAAIPFATVFLPGMSYEDFTVF